MGLSRTKLLTQLFLECAQGEKLEPITINGFNEIKNVKYDLEKEGKLVITQSEYADTKVLYPIRGALKYHPIILDDDFHKCVDCGGKIEIGMLFDDPDICMMHKIIRDWPRAIYVGFVQDELLMRAISSSIGIDIPQEKPIRDVSSLAGAYCVEQLLKLHGSMRTVITTIKLLKATI